MAAIPKILVMLVRSLALVSIILGILVWTGQMSNLLGAHIGIGFLISLSILILGILALAKRAIPAGLLAIVGAVALPYIGFRQFPLAFMHFGAAQVAHVLVVIAALGLAEMSYSAIRRAN